MQPPWLYCPQLAAGAVALDESEARHARLSLRLKPGDAVALFDGRWGVAHGKLAEDAAGEARPSPAARSVRKHGLRTIVVVERIESIPPPARRLTLIVAACKGPRLDFLVEKCTELGATRLVFAEFERSVVRLGSTHVEKLRRTAIEACKQCGRAWLPEIEASLTLADAVKHRADAALLIAHPAADAAPLGTWLQQHREAAGDIAVVIGPEGGLAPDELHSLLAAGAQPVRLGEHVLRVETAAVAAAATWAATTPQTTASATEAASKRCPDSQQRP
jgi:16S rRNA (uracil1498-N3)-methyltransferase